MLFTQECENFQEKIVNALQLPPCGQNLLLQLYTPLKKVYLSQGFLTNRRSLQYLLPWSAPETIWVKLVGMKDVDGTFYAEMMQLTGDL